MTSKRVLIVAGGTGGHIFPALAVAAHLRAHQVTPFWLGSAHGMEGILVPKHNIDLIKIAITGVRGKGVLRWLFAPIAICNATIAAIIAILRIQPGVVLGMGGFVSGPGGLAAWICRKPLVIHEQNAVPGLTNRILRCFATRVLAAYPGTFAATAKVTVIGNPVRPEITQIPPPELRLHTQHALRVLVLGGSLGARSLNRVVPSGLAHFQSTSPIEVRHQTGARDLSATSVAYKQLQIAATTEAFISDMAAAYAWADVVIGRAGALTIAELSAVGIPSILVPFPYAVDDHQTVNAAYLSNNGAAITIRDADLSAESLAMALHEITDDRTRMLEMAQRARAASYPSAAADVAQCCLALLHD